jgi:hypothetical protein
MGANAVTTVPVYVAGEVLTAADLNITNSGIPVFDTSVERDAAFGGTGEKTLAEGQFAYLETGNVTQYYDGAVWQSVGVAPGLVPIVPTSVAVGSGSATTSANGLVTFTGASSISLNGVFSATYNNYCFKFSTSAVSTTNNISLRLRAAGSDVTTSTYTSSSLISSDNTASAGYQTETSWNMIISTRTANPNSILNVELQNPFLAVSTLYQTRSWHVSNAQSYLQYLNGGFQSGATSFDGMSIVCSTGNIDGLVSVYGYTI